MVLLDVEGSGRVASRAMKVVTSHNAAAATATHYNDASCDDAANDEESKDAGYDDEDVEVGTHCCG